MMMMKMSLWLLLSGFAVTYAAAAGPASCAGRCGEVFTRGQMCTCDFSCHLHNECCHDFQATCTAAQSCQGRCGEAFRRGRLCECDPQCVQYNTCCHDHQLHCDARSSVSHSTAFQPVRSAASGNERSDSSWRMSNSASEEWFTGVRRIPVGGVPSSPAHGSSLPSYGAPSLGSSAPVTPSGAGAVDGVRNIPVGGVPYSPAHGSSLPSYGAPSLGSSAAVTPSGPGAVDGVRNIPVGGVPSSPAHGSSLPSYGAPSLGSSAAVTPSGPGTVDGLMDPAGSRLGPNILQQVTQFLGLVEGGSDGPGTGLLADINLCSDSPINGLTALRNGTLLIFKGEHFWSVDPASRSVGHPQSIADILGVASPIDTVFTRCNCHGNTYIIKGDQYWRLDGNMVMEPGFPKPLASEFPGLTGSISAALTVPATGSRPETVFFFKKGDVMQRFIFPPGSSASCHKTPGSFLTRRFARQAGVRLSGEINVKVSLKGFPTPVTSALSMPRLQSSDLYDLYDLYVFSGPLFFRVQISDDLPALVKPHPSAVLVPLSAPVSPDAVTANMAADPPLPVNSITVWLRCP